MTRRDVLSAILFLGTLAVGSGCSVMPYQPNEGKVRELGKSGARTELKATVLRARAAGGGTITGVEVGDESLKVKAQHGQMGMFYQVSTVQVENEIYFGLVDRVDLYSNNWAYVYQRGGQLGLQVLLASPEDAKTFADLVMSLRAQKKG